MGDTTRRFFQCHSYLLRKQSNNCSFSEFSTLATNNSALLFTEDRNLLLFFVFFFFFTRPWKTTIKSVLVLLITPEREGKTFDTNTWTLFPCQCKNIWIVPKDVETVLFIKGDLEVFFFLI